MGKPLPGDLAFSIADAENPVSLVNVAPNIMKPAILKVVERSSVYFRMLERKLRYQARIAECDERLRLAFWDEYMVATSSGAQMRTHAFINQWTMPIEDFLKVFIQKPGPKLAYIIRPPVNYAASMRVLLNQGIEKLHEIMTLPVTDVDGKPNAAIISQILKAYNLIDLRVKGAIVQKMQIQQQNMNYNADVTQIGNPRDAQIIQQLSSMSMEELESMERKMARLEKTIQVEAKSEVAVGEESR